MREDEYSYKFFENRACEYFPCARYDKKIRDLIACFFIVQRIEQRTA